jgi:hypothetical protein
VVVWLSRPRRLTEWFLSVLPIWKELSAQFDPHTIPIGIGLTGQVHSEVDGTHDAVPELLLDQLLQRFSIFRCDDRPTCKINRSSALKRD